MCFALRATGEVVTAIDDKPKSGRKLARVRHLAINPGATMLFDRWDEDWRRLGWVQVRGHARLEAPGSANVELAQRYEQYRAQPPPGDVVVLVPQIIVWWTFV